ncbi:hypothetical protein ACFVXC_06900 [Streptomyces sp. NPDC058257]|uniref:hypothetical protein n=1 Tax=Streptomyces sp. NPDC058257 TaxID=3346409 RepID=UPI0036E7F9CF
MSERDQETYEPEAAALRQGHAARAESAAARAAAMSHYIERGAGGTGKAGGVGGTGETGGTGGQPSGSAADENAVWKAAHAARVAAQALAVLSESAPDPAADSRCARNAAASAAQAAQMGQLVDGGAEPSLAACQAALKASLAASSAAGARYLGADEELNSQADMAERAAVVAAERAGWIRPGTDVPAVSTGVRSPEVMSMLHF